MIAAEVKYKQTKFLWLPEIPEHWNLFKVKHLFSIGRGRVIAQTELIDDGLYPVYSSQTQDDGVLGYINTFDFEGEMLTWTTDGVNAGSVFHRTGKFNTTNVCGVLNSKTDNYIKFLYYALAFVAPKCKRPDTNGAKIMNNEMAVITIPVPPIEEQKAIADYLDIQSAKITRFIQTKQRFIELLKEQRQSIIDESLNIEAQKIRLKFCVSKVGSGVTPKGGASVYQSSGVIFLRSQNIHNDSLRLDDVAFITNKIHSEMSSSQVKRGDVLLNITGASIGRCHWFDSDEEANVNQHVSIIRPFFDILDSEFLMYQIQSQRIQHLINTVQGASREGLTIHEIKNYPLLVPSTLEEQKRIVEHIKTETRTLDIAISKAEREIELIKEYREAMIAEAVTGKMKLYGNE